MTVSPQTPVLRDTEEEGTKELAENHLTFVKVGLGYSLMILLKAGYRTDGASIPGNLLDDEKYGDVVRKLLEIRFPDKDPREAFQWLAGTPWDMPRLLAALPHDALYGRKWKCRWLCDRIYKWILEENNYEKVRTTIEYDGIRLIGWRNWDAVSDWERVLTKRQSAVKWVKTKKVPLEIEKLSKKS